MCTGFLLALDCFERRARYTDREKAVVYSVKVPITLEPGCRAHPEHLALK